MALKATIYKADLNIANMDVHQYGDYQLTMALHPSETIERLMVRILAFARYADEALEFTKDLFETDEPALWQKDLTGQLINWIEVGCPDEDKVKKASARCQQVAVVAYGSNVDDWYKRSSKLKTLKNVQVWKLSTATTEAIQKLCERTMQLQLNVMDGEWTLIGDQAQAVIEWEQLQ
ncbi:MULTISPECIES: YaeQ family protein [Acinetobacter]|uniref:YaeQ family protein n=1 Tax=Acinetobacter indicus TaxID=756892 RepID=A0A7S7AFB0_9GAMM|nr:MULTISPECIES: YaeQ family protein [Acinetobacter]MDM1277344.1 YaeQ family protein [Acinetobacter indicus]MDM1770841.1 YaeQ family protein [Acinetobacter indicus]MDM1773633.1 YaeQ family protein [Acinetobacter indicus]QIC76610.1 YaeQ family protein [Acinetobacter indicus]QIC79566.1 YaeQ family protein [Acinetobacter indicus]